MNDDERQQDENGGGSEVEDRLRDKSDPSEEAAAEVAIGQRMLAEFLFDALMGEVWVAETPTPEVKRGRQAATQPPTSEQED